MKAHRREKQAERLWSEDERLAFIDWIAVNPLSGDVIPGWRAKGSLEPHRVWQVQRRTGDPFQPDRTGSGVAGGGVCQGGARQHASRGSQKGSGAWS